MLEVSVFLCKFTSRISVHMMDRISLDQVFSIEFSSKFQSVERTD